MLRQLVTNAVADPVSVTRVDKALATAGVGGDDARRARLLAASARSTA